LLENKGVEEEIAKRWGVMTMAYGALGGGEIVGNEIVEEVARRKGCNVGGAGELLVEFVAGVGITSVVVSSRDENRMKSNFDVWEARRGARGGRCVMSEAEWEELRLLVGLAGGKTIRFTAPDAFAHIFK